MRRHLGCPYANSVSVIDGIRQSQCLAVAVPAASCSRSGGRQRGNPCRQNASASDNVCDACPGSWDWKPIKADQRFSEMVAWAKAKDKPSSRIENKL